MESATQDAESSFDFFVCIFLFFLNVHTDILGFLDNSRLHQCCTGTKYDMFSEIVGISEGDNFLTIDI